MRSFSFTVPLLLSFRNQNCNLYTCFSKILTRACRVLFWRTERLSDFGSFFAGLRVGVNLASHCALRLVAVSFGLNTRKTTELPCRLVELYHSCVTCGDGLLTTAESSILSTRLARCKVLAACSTTLLSFSEKLPWSRSC